MLTSLDGLQGLTTVGDVLNIERNVVLADVTALYGLQSVWDVYVMDNVSLTDAAAEALVDEIDVIGGDVWISGN